VGIKVEKDSMGEIQIPGDRLWGAQTQRSLENFKIGKDKMPIEIIKAFAILKKAAALTNYELGWLEKKFEETGYVSPDYVLPDETVNEKLKKIIEEKGHF